jgi:predicted RNA-binding Zn-ribbon protein involved in translation (DUF1610 family)
LQHLDIPVKLPKTNSGELMGSSHLAHCTCGYETEVNVGGGMRDFRTESYFPHYCVTCGLVEVNIAKSDDTGVAPLCPKCGSSGIHEYGTKAVALPIEKNRVALEWDPHQAMEKGNLCPACKQMTLVFDCMPSILSD